MKKKVMLIGRSQCGKTSLLQSLNNIPIHYKKTQALDFQYFAIDTPGEYLENPRLYSALICSSCDADIVAFVQSADNPTSIFAPQFASAFNKPIIGIITKIDATAEDGCSKSKIILQEAGVSTIFMTSAYQQTGLEPLRKYFNWT
jgi:ethanolamine utilization protein EutP